MATQTITLQGVDKTKSAFKSVINSTKKAATGAKKLLSVFRDLVVVGGGIKTAFKGLARAMDAVVDAAMRQQKAELGVLIGLARTEKETVKSFKAFRKWAAEVQNATGVGDEFLFELGRIGTNIGKMGREEMQDAIIASLDFAQAMGVDAKGAMLNLSKLLSTGTADFGRMGLTIESTGSNADKFAEAIAKMKSGLSGMAGALPVMQLQKLKNAFGDAVESIGFLITSTGTWRVVLGGLTKGVGKLADIIRDPQFIKEWGKAFDEAFVKGLRTASLLLGNLLIGLGQLVNVAISIASTFKAIDMDALAPPGLRQDMDAIKTSLAGYAVAIKAVNAGAGLLDFKGRVKEVNRLRGEMHRLNVVLSQLRSQIPLAGDTLQNFGRDLMSGGFAAAGSILDQAITAFDELLGPIAAKAKAYFDSLKSGAADASSRARDSLVQLAEEAGSLMELADSDKNFFTDEKRDAISAEVEELGAAWGSTLAGAMATGIEESDSIGGAFSVVGEQARTNFIGQMTQEAFAPMTATFGLLAKAAAMPFKIVGTVVNDLILQPIAEFATSIIADLLKGLLKIFIAEKVQQGGTAAALAAFNVVYLPTLSLLTAGAVASSISSFGASLSAGPPALAAVKAAGVSALAFEEGGLVFPTGSRAGRQVTVAEREPEFIIGASQAGGFARRVIGYSQGDININIDTIAPDANVDDLQVLADRVAAVFEERLAELAATGRRL